MISLLEPRRPFRKDELIIKSKEQKINSLLLPKKNNFDKNKERFSDSFKSINDINNNIFENIIGEINNKFYLIKKIGSGSSSKVYLGLSKNQIEKNENNNYNNNILYYSIKVIKLNNLDISLFKNEVQLLETIEHINILKIYEYGKGLLSKIKSGKKKEIYYIVMEYLEHGELFDYITKISKDEPKGFGENLGRVILSNLLMGLEEIHNKNIFHRDIKLENIMLGKDYIPKFVDFGFCTNEIGKLNTFLGTPSYAAPELHLRQKYYGKAIDIFSLGVCLFIIVTGSLPFKLAMPNDRFYQYFIRNDYVGFWKNRGINLSPSFMELFNNMAAFDFTQRPSISEIKQSAWMKEINYELKPFLKDEFILREKLIYKIKYENIIKEIRLTQKENKLSLIEAKPIKEINNNKDIIITNNYNIKNMTESNKGFIRVKVESKNYNNALTKLKKYFKNKGFLSIKRNYNEYELVISDGEIEIILKLEKYNNIYGKLNYCKLKGINKNFENFKKFINALKDKAL